MEISLLIPAYNAEHFLPAIMADAHAQHPPFSEIIIYDDASTDDTVAVAKSLQVSQVILGGVNRGAAYARNRLIEAARSPWIHFHDADDRLSPNYTKAVSSRCPRPNQAIICGLNVYDVKQGRVTETYEFDYLNRDTRLEPVLETNFQLGCGLYHRDSLRGIGGFREHIRGGEDFDLHVRLKLAGVEFLAIPERLNTYCRYGTITFTETNEGRLHSDVLRVFEHYTEELPKTSHAVLGRLLMELGYKLFANGQYDEADRAIQLARTVGRHSVASSHQTIRLLSLLVGAKNIFKLRTLAAKLSRLGR